MTRQGQLIDAANLASGFATMMRGPAKRAMQGRAKGLYAEAIALSPVSPDIAAMSDDDILAALK